MGAHSSLFVRPVVLAQVIPLVHRSACLIRKGANLDRRSGHEALGAEAVSQALEDIDCGEHLLDGFSVHSEFMNG